ncbi:MAG TPA: deoxynucleoside kinase [Myxococcales bacterium]|nr:deoxynucleoside kinase [Myxococcales bacterium]
MERLRYIVVEGPIGVGKTSLVHALARHYRARTVFEIVEENPFLASFYQDRSKFAFQTQLFFLLSRFKQQQDLFQQDLFSQVTVSDHLFAKDRIFASITLDPNELALYERVYEHLGPRVMKPDLVIYLQARLEVLLARIKKRGRDFERKFDAEYLAELSRTYNDFFHRYDETPLLIINTSDIDFVESDEDFDELIRAVGSIKYGTHYYQPLGTRILSR